MKIMQLKLSVTLVVVLSAFHIQFAFTQDDTFPNIYKITDRIQIDGEVDARWNEAEAHNLIYMINGSNYPSAADCSGYFKALWMSDSLYLLMHATDDIVGTGSANAWENDGFEVYFDMDNSKDTVYMEDNYQFRFNLNSNDITGENGPDSYDPPDVPFAIQHYPEHYNILEAVFPLVELGMEPPVAGRYMGFDVQILDNDGSGRECAMAWNNNEHEAYFNPSKMGTVLFSDANLPTLIEALNQHYKFYPNPVNDRLTIESNKAIGKLRILSVDGRLIDEADFVAGPVQSVNLSWLQKGLYFIEVTGELGETEILQIIKN
jgi:hypothetical protein